MKMKTLMIADALNVVIAGAPFIIISFNPVSSPASLYLLAVVIPASLVRDSYALIHLMRYVLSINTVFTYGEFQVR